MLIERDYLSAGNEYRNTDQATGILQKPAGAASILKTGFLQEVCHAKEEIGFYWKINFCSTGAASPSRYLQKCFKSAGAKMYPGATTITLPLLRNFGAEKRLSAVFKGARILEGRKGRR